MIGLVLGVVAAVVIIGAALYLLLTNQWPWDDHKF